MARRLLYPRQPVENPFFRQLDDGERMAGGQAGSQRGTPSPELRPASHFSHDFFKEFDR